MLEQFLTHDVFAFMLAFCRLGSGVMMMSGFGEAFVSPRIRLMFALMFSLLLLPVVHAAMPALPANPLGLLALVAKEICTGLYLGLASRILIAATHVAGTIIAQETGLASAVVQDFNTQAAQSTIVTNMLSVTALTLFFATNLHYVVLQGFAESYQLFAPGALPPVGDFAEAMVGLVSHTFSIAMHLAAPHLVIGLILYLGAGVLARLMPTMQIFFILMAPQIMIGLFVLMVVLPGLMLWYMGQLRDGLLNVMPF